LLQQGLYPRTPAGTAAATGALAERTQLLQASAASLPDGALALVETARGPLLHLAALDAAGRISRYRVVPPTCGMRTRKGYCG
jgi:Ni,Fe-hydrogenase III large subunit